MGGLQRSYAHVVRVRRLHCTEGRTPEPYSAFVAVERLRNTEATMRPMRKRGAIRVPGTVIARLPRMAERAACPTGASLAWTGASSLETGAHRERQLRRALRLPGAVTD